MLEGYAQAGVTDIVALAGASVGSLYHHFSGKADLYLALFEELHNEHDVRTRKAVRECRDMGVTDPMRLLLAGARGYLDVCIEQRDLAGMFARGDGPPGFEVHVAPAAVGLGPAAIPSSSRAAASHWTRPPRS